MCNKKFTFLSILLGLFFLTSPLYSFFSFRGPHHISFGPEIFYMTRIKEGGSRQEGTLSGCRLSYDRIRRSALYWGAEGMYASGVLYGHNNNKFLLSLKRDSEIEGRFGYTFKKRACYNFWMTPFFGVGYFEGTNKFCSPSPMEYKIKVRFPYLVTGIFSKIDFTDSFSAGLNFKTKYSVGAKGSITENSQSLVEDSRFYIEDKFSYEVELPLSVRKNYCNRQCEVSLIPFYRFRHYGGHENFPYNFIDTKFHIGGARLMLSTSF